MDEGLARFRSELTAHLDWFAERGRTVRFWWRDKSALALRALHYFRQFGDACRGRPVTLDQFDEGAGAYRRRAD